jgi:hypothetical protein
MLTDLRDGRFSLQQIPYDTVMERYGEGDYAQALRSRRADGYRDEADAEAAYS